jgi:hypothetical protein
VIEKELGAPLHEIFSHIDEVPVGAASIGAVHFATLAALPHRQVAVKVQYPEAEAFFQLDFKTILLFFKLVNPQLVDVVRAQQSLFANEFDYRKEGRNLRLMCSRVKDRFANLNFPAPYDDEHPHLPPLFKGTGKCLVTQRVLVMDRCEGKTLTKIGGELLKQLAESQGVTVEQLVATVRKKMLDPNFVDKFADSQSMPSERTLALLQSLLLARDAFQNVFLRSYNLIFSSALRVAAPLPLARSRLPPNGPRLMRFLYEVQGMCIFELGAFNPDLHAGNVMLDEETGVVTLLDYGQLVPLGEEYKLNFAKYIIAVDDKNKEAVKEYWAKLGNEFVWNETGEVNPLDETFACACFHFGGSVGMKEGMRILGFKNISEVMGKNLFEKLTITKTEACYGFLQRSGVCLSGVAQQIGVGGISTAKYLRPAAEKFLKKKGEWPPPHHNAKK